MIGHTHEAARSKQGHLPRMRMNGLTGSTTEILNMRNSAVAAKQNRANGARRHELTGRARKCKEQRQQAGDRCRHKASRVTDSPAVGSWNSKIAFTPGLRKMSDDGVQTEASIGVEKQRLRLRTVRGESALGGSRAGLVRRKSASAGQQIEASVGDGMPRRGLTWSRQNRSWDPACPPGTAVAAGSSIESS
jgi:hypothetical protein